MKRILLCLLALLTACVLLSACGHGKPEESAAAPTPAPAVPTPEPTPELPPYEPNILTGAPRDASYVPDQRPVAIMINNIFAARPHRGLSKADILVEIQVEGGITRLMGIFQDYKSIGEVGPVRSGRDQFFQLILPWQMLYVHEGQSSVMTIYSHNASDSGYGREDVLINSGTANAQYISNGQGLLNMNTAGAYGYRNTNRYNWAGANYNVITGYTDDGTPIHQLAYEHTLYLNSDCIDNYIQTESAYGLDMQRAYNSTFFNFVDYRTATGPRDLAAGADANYVTDYGPVVSDGEYVEITHSQSYRTRFIYDPAAQQYNMQMYYSDYNWRDVIDEAADNQSLSFPNLVILFTDIHTYPGHEKKDLKEVVYADGGAGYYCYGGKCERIYWQKGAPGQALQLYYLTEDGKCSDIPLEMNIGRTYLAVVGLDFYNNFVHKPLSEVDVSANTSYAGTVTGPAASSYEVGEDDDGGSDNTAPAAEPTPAPTEEITVDNHEHVFDARGNCTICGLYVYEKDTYFFPPEDQSTDQQPADQSAEQPPAEETPAEPQPEAPAEGGDA